MEDKRTEKRKTGDRGEAIAAAHLEAKGYRVIARNFRCKAGEIDIIARHGDVLCFAEVKTRRPGRFGRPCEAVDWKKQRRLSDRYRMRFVTAALEKKMKETV